MKNIGSSNISLTNSHKLTLSQTGLLLECIERPSDALFHAQIVIHINDVIDTDILNQSWALVAQKHDALRTSIDADAGVARVHETFSLNFQVEDVNFENEYELDEQVRQWQSADLHTPFDLMAPPLWRVKVIRSAMSTRVLWSFHYLILDDLSADMVLKEVRQCYTALSHGQGYMETDAPQLSEFIEWLDEQPDRTTDEFWDAEVSNLSFAPKLPWERSALSTLRPEEEEPLQIERVSVPLTGDGLKCMEQTASVHGLTIEKLVQGAWALLLGTYLGTDEAVLGITTSGRSGPSGLDKVVGCLIRTLPLRLDLAPQRTVSHWLSYLGTKTEAIRQHEHCTLAQIYGMAHLTPGEVLFDSVVMSVATTDCTEDSIDQAQWRTISRETHPPYSLVIEVTSDRLPAIYIRYDTRRYHRSAIERAAHHLVQTLDQLCTCPDATLGELRLIPTDEWQKLVVEWNDTDAEYSNLHMQTLFEHRAAKTPNAVALLFGDDTKTYAEVDDQANRVANYLLSQGVRRSEYVAILTERSIEMIPVLLGVLKASACYIPLDPGAPPKRWRQVLKTMDVKYLLTQTSIMQRLESEGVLADMKHVILLDEDAQNIPTSGFQVHSPADILQASTEQPPLLGSPNDPAYVIFTSGTTGTPKGVVVTHAPAVNLIEWVNRTFQVSQNDRILFITSLTFDLSVYDIFGILAAGGSIRIAKGDDIREPAELVRYIREEPITFWDSAPAALMQILPFLESGSNAPVSDNIRLVFMSGDWVPLRAPSALRAAFPNVTVVSLGGATEATVWSNFFVVDQVDPGWASIPYGRPIQNAHYLVLDKSLRPCPLEVPGDLYIGGLCLSSGYANDPGLTCEKYIASPYESKGERLYRTGDTARWRQDGNLEFMGRTDTQVKIRGYRIELGEIDSILAEHQQVQDSVTLVREDETGDRSLATFVVLASSAEGLPDVNDLAESRVDRWCNVYDNINYQSENKDDFSGWSSSYTGLPLGHDEMTAWRDEFVSLVLSCHPNRVLEVGCGTGLILSKVAPHCERYMGIDFSTAALGSARSRINTELSEIVSLQQGEADSVGKLDIDPVDTVILNSIIQYFPNSDYLCRVLDGVLSHVAEGGRIIVGDVRSLPLLKAFHASVEESRSPDSSSRATLRDAVTRRVSDEEELVIDPAFFRMWALQSGRIDRVEITPKCNGFLNEMSMYRYQVVMRVGRPSSVPPEVPGTVEVNWSDAGLTLDILKHKLLENPGRLRVTGIPNARVDLAVRTAAWLFEEDQSTTIAQWRDMNTKTQGIEPDEVVSLANSIGFAISLDWGRHGSDGSFDALFVRGTEAIDERCWLTLTDKLPETPLTAYTNNPIRQDTQELLLSGLREYLTERLPTYMVPAEIIAVESMPVTSSGKLDRRALLSLKIDCERGHYTAPRTITERVLVGLWEEVLSYPHIGVMDSFFDLGGHSLLAVRLAMRIKNVFSVDVPVRIFFDHPTISEVAQELVRIQQAAQGMLLPPIEKASRQSPIPASFEQQRIYFIDRINPGMTAYTINWIVPLSTDMDEQQIRSILTVLIERHEILRTTLHESEGRVWQVISPTTEVVLPSLTVANADEAQARIRDWWNQPFDLKQGPLVRALVVRIDGKNRCLAMSAHHTVFDGYSIGLFLDEFRAISWGNGANVLPIEADPGIMHYGDYAAWQHNAWLKEEFLQQHLDYWKNQLSEAPERLEFPIDRPSSSMQSFAGDLLQRRLSLEQSEHVQTWSSSHQVTEYMTLLSVFSVLLSRLSGQDVVVIGVPIANRNRPELEHMIGFLVSSVPLCIDLGGAPSFSEIVCQVRQKLFDGQAHQEVPLERLVELLRPSRDLSYNPIFQVMCADESLPLFEQSSDSANFDPWMRTVIEQGMSVGSSRFDLTLMIQRETDGVHLNLEYCTDLFNRASMEVLMDRFEVLLDAALSDSSKPVGLLPLLLDSEKSAVLAQYSCTSTPLPLCGLDQWFRDTASKYPDRVALSSNDSQVTYAKLVKLASGIAGLLQERGVSRGRLVGLCVPRSMETVVAVLGIVSAGAAYVPLDPSFPQERLAFMVADSGVSVVVASRSVMGVLPESVTDILVLEDVWDDLVTCDTESIVVPGVSADDLAYVMYTSGSTGQPKGVAITHRGILTLGMDSRLWQHNVVLVHSPQAFDASTYEMWVPLISGGCCHVALPGEITPEQLRWYVSIGGLTVVFVTAALFHFLASQDPGCFTGLREVWTGGDAVHADAIRAVKAACPDITVADAYGPTEVTVMATYSSFEPGSIVPDPTPIGKALDRHRLLVLDSRMQVVPVGVAGELYVGGSGLARGYVGRADLTSEAFVADPFAGDGSRLYRTGDRVKLLPSGDLEWLSRIDQQVKIRGFRIELSEIEQALEQHPIVSQAVVLVDKDGPSKRLVAFVALHEPMAEEVLREFVGERLPNYMVPSVVVTVDALPLGPTGKVDRKTLAGMIPAGGSDEYVAARTMVEEQLAIVWGDVLGLGRPAGIFDDFFALGGDSILSLQVVFRARQVGIHLTVKQLFEHPMIADLASVVDMADTEVVHAEQGIVTGSVELTPVQKWFFNRSLVNPDYFNQSVVVEVPSEVSVQDWERIVGHLLEHHDGFRTRFVYADGVWCAEMVGVPEVVPFKVVDVAGVEIDNRTELMEKIGKEVQAGFHLDSPPLFQAVLFTGWDTDGCRLLLVAHHLVVDVVSWWVVLEDLATLIDAVRRSEPLVLPKKTTSWRQWAARMSAEASSDRTTAEVEFWNTQTVPPERGLPLDGQVSANTVARSGRYDAVLDAENTQALLQEIPAVFGTQVNDVLLTAVGAALGAWSGSGTVRLDLEGHGREELFNDVDVSRTVGWFTTISPVSVPVASADLLVTRLKQVKELMRSRPRHGIGYGLLFAGLAGEDRSAAQVSFNYLGQFDDVGGQFVSGMGMAGPDWDPRNERPYLIDIVGQVTSGQLHLKWDYCRDAHEQTTIARVAEHAMSVLRDLVAAARDSQIQGYTPSDFPASGMSQEQIDLMIAQVRHLPVWHELNTPRPLLDCYPQTPVQQGLWFQSRLASNEGVYHVQMVFTIEHELDTNVLRRAWSEVMRRHPALRTSFWEDETGQAFQLVWDLNETPLDEQDWSGQSDYEQLLNDYLDNDRARGFDPSDAPQWHILLARTAPDTYQMIWSTHHAILDGWSIGLVLNDLTNTYDTLLHAAHRPITPAPKPYRDYVSWLSTRDLDYTETFWRTYLQDFDCPTQLPLEIGDETGSVVNKTGHRAERRTEFSQDLTQRLNDFVKASSLTLNTVMQGVWAVLLGRYAGVDDVVFGTIMSGRTSEVVDIERMVGLFINTLPLRVRLPDQQPVIDWLHGLQDNNLQIRQQEHTPLNLIRGWTDIPSGSPLFHTLFDFENYPIESRKGSLRPEMTRSEERVDSPIGIVVMVHEVLEVCVQYDTAFFSEATVDLLLMRLISICQQFIDNPEQALGRVGLLSKKEQMDILAQGVSQESAIMGDDTDLKDYVRNLSDPDELALLEQLLSAVKDE